MDGTGHTESLDQETKLSIEQSLKRLKPHYRDVIILKFFEDLTVQQIAEILDKPEGTIKTWLRRSLQDMKGILKEEDLYGGF